MPNRHFESARTRTDSLKRLSRDSVDVAASLESKDAARSLRDLSHPPAMKKMMRDTGVALALAPEPVTTAAGVALVAGSLTIKNEPATLRSMMDELGSEISELSEAGLDISSISFSATD